METLKFKVFNFLNKSKETTVPLVLLYPTLPICSFVSRNGNTSVKKYHVLKICRWPMVKIIIIYLAMAANEAHFLRLLP